MAFLAASLGLLLVGPCSALRSSHVEGASASSAVSAGSAAAAVAERGVLNLTMLSESELLRDHMDSERVRACPCWNIFNSLKPSDCCARTDAGSLNWKGKESATCGAQTNIGGHEYPVDECSSYCRINCYRVHHKDDKQGLVEYLGEKMSEVSKMGIADVLLGRAVWQAQAYKTGETPTFVHVEGIHPIHPVGGWREDTWVKTQGRKEAVLAAEPLIKKRGQKLTTNDMNKKEVLKPMRSVTPFMAVPFPFCGWEYVLLEGNGRLKGMQLAAKEDPALHDMSVEVQLFEFTPDRLKQVQRSIALLWNQYVKEALALDPVKDGAQIIEYNTFRVGVVKCKGVKSGWFFTSIGPCPVVDDSGKEIDSVQPSTLFGASEMKVVGSEWWFKRCEGDGWVVSKAPGGVMEYCPDCYDRKLG